MQDILRREGAYDPLPLNIEDVDRIIADEIQSGTLSDSDRGRRIAELRASCKPWVGTVEDVIESLRLTAIDYASDVEPLIRTIPVGMSPLIEANARVMPTPSGGFVIILNQGLMVWLYTFSIAILDGFADTPTLSDHDRFWAALASLSYAGCPKLSSAGLAIPFPESFLAMRRTEGDILYPGIIGTFAILHEFGHVALNHLSDPQLESLSMAGRDVPAYLSSHEQEFAADAWALARLRVDSNPVGVAAVLAPLFLFLLTWETAFGRKSTTHPSPLIRWFRITTMLFGRTHPPELSRIDGVFMWMWRRIATFEPGDLSQR